MFFALWQHILLTISLPYLQTACSMTFSPGISLIKVHVHIFKWWLTQHINTDSITFYFWHQSHSLIKSSLLLNTVLGKASLISLKRWFEGITIYIIYVHILKTEKTISNLINMFIFLFCQYCNKKEVRSIYKCIGKQCFFPLKYQLAMICKSQLSRTTTSLKFWQQVPSLHTMLLLSIEKKKRSYFQQCNTHYSTRTKAGPADQATTNSL